MVFSAKLYDASFGNAKGGRTNPPPNTGEGGKHRLRARVKTRDAPAKLSGRIVDFSTIHYPAG